MGFRSSVRKLKNITSIAWRSVTWPAQVVVLIYHRVTKLSSDPQLLAVSPKRFREQIVYLRDHFPIIGLRDMIRDLRGGSLVDGSVVVTFDDGYRDNALEAYPILDEIGVPATFFITAGYLDGSREFWWDELESLLQIGARMEQALKLHMNGSHRIWNLRSPSARTTAYQEIHTYMKSQPLSVIEKTLDQLRQHLSDGYVAPRNTHRCLTREDVAQIARNRNIEIGAHTMSHCSLANQSAQQQQEEVGRSKLVLESITGKRIDAFSYPFGTRSDVSAETRKIVAQVGFTCGIANMQANVSRRTDPYWVPRRIIRNWDLNYFQRQLHRFSTQDRRHLAEGLQKKTGLWRLPASKVFHQTLLPEIKKCHARGVVVDPPLSRIVQLNTVDNWGGAAKVAIRLQNQLNARGYASTLLVHRAVDDSDDITVLVKENGRRQRVLEHAEKRLGWPGLFAIASLGISQHPVVADAQLVHIHNLHGGYFTPFALPSLTCEKPTVWTLHDMAAFTGHCAQSYGCERWKTGCGKCPHLTVWEPVEVDGTKSVWRTKRKIYKVSQITLVSPSKWLMNKIDQSILSDRDTHLIYNGVDTQLFADRNKTAVRAELGLPTDRRILLFSAAGGLQNEFKGGAQIPFIIERTAKLQGVLCLVLGGDKNIDRENILSVPYVSDEQILARYYAAADVMIYPTAADNCPLVVLEALSCGTPVVAYGVGGIPELITHMRNGYVARSHDPKDLVRGVDWLLKDSRSSRAALEARKAVEERFTLQIMVDRYERLYKKVFERWLEGFSEIRA